MKQKTTKLRQWADLVGDSDADNGPPQGPRGVGGSEPLARRHVEVVRRRLLIAELAYIIVYDSITVIKK